jgi:steroid 5-alpha reductase family enzyme
MNHQIILLFLFIYFTAWYLLAFYLKNASYVDVGWGAGFFLLSLLVQLTINKPMGWILFVMVFIWGARLSSHILRRNFKKPEDYRYANFRKAWGKSYALRSYFQLFLFQGILMYLISIANIQGQSIATLTYLPLIILGILVYSAGLGLESVADSQLRRHIRDPKNKGKLIQNGAWRYSRHPNYFGESLVWWGVYIVSIGLGAPLWTSISPIIITLLVRFVSGVPLLEERLKRYVGYEAYVKNTSIFIPRMPRKGESK